MNIRTKLTFLFSVLVASILLVFSLAIYYSYARYRQSNFYDRLREKALTTVHLLEDVRGMNAELLRTIDHSDLNMFYQDEITIYDARNRVIYDSGNKPFPVSKDFLRQIRMGKEIELRHNRIELVGIHYRDPRKDTLAVVAYATDIYGFNKLTNLRNTLITGWCVSVGVVVLAGYVFAGNALRPISRIVDQVTRISAENIHLRLDTGNQHDELARLAQTFNDMLARLEEAFTLQKSFVSHASHELRTPLTVIAGQIEVTAMQERSSAEYRATLDLVLEEVRHMTALTNELLELARVSADAATIPFQPVRVDELLWQARSELLRKKPEYNVDVSFDKLPENEEEWVISGNEALLKTALLNVMENGCKYSGDHRVSVTIRTVSTGVVLAFTDQGAGIPTGDLPYIFKPFYRSEHTQHINGHGIGLALTHRIIHLHRGSIRVKSVINQGTTFTCIFPILFNRPLTSVS